jgi:uncharacterized membrane protein
MKSVVRLWAGATFITLIYVGLRLWRLADSCLWFDEIFGVHAATMDWGVMFAFLAQDLIHPPLFYVLLKVWIAAGGESLLWLRLFPVFWSVLAVVPFVLLCRELRLKTSETLTALAFVAVNGALIRYAQEVRMYSLLFCFALFVLWLFVRFWRNGSKRVLLALFLCNLLAVYTHYFGWLLVATQFLAILFFKRKKLRQFLVLVGGLVLSFLPWLWAVWNVAATQDKLAQNIGWQTKPGLLTLVQFPFVLSEPFYYPQSNVDPANIWLVAVLITFIVLGAIGFYLWRERKSFNDDAVYLLAFFITAPLILAFAASWISPLSVWGTRHLIIVFAPFSILAAVAVWRLPDAVWQWSAIGLIGLCVLVGGLIHFLKKPQVFIWCGWGELAHRLESTEQTTVYVFEDDGAYHLWFALRRNPQFRVVSVDGYADMPEDKAYFLPRGFDDVKIIDKNAITGDKFWLAFRAAKWNPDKQVLQELTARGYKIGEPLNYRAQGVTIFFVPIAKTE